MPKKAKVKVPKVSTKQEARGDIDPQLCKTFNPDKHKWDGTWFAEPKFDGLRCLIVVETVDGVRWIRPYSRNGKPLWNMTKIIEAVAATQIKNVVLDGEVYTKDWNLSMSIVKRSTQSHPDQDKLRYHVWDCLTLKEWEAGKSDVSNYDRKIRLASLYEVSKYIQAVVGRPIDSQEELQEVYTSYLLAGYEGAIVKRSTGIYEKGRRSPNWLKIKPWTDADLTIVGAYPGEGKHLGRIGGLIVEGECEWQGKTYTVHTEVGTGFTDEEREYFQGLWDSESLVGHLVEIKFQDITVDGACRFPVYNRLREDK